MSSFQKTAAAALLMMWLAGQAVAGNVFVLPANTFDTSVTVLSDSTFQSVTTLTVPPGVKGVFARPDGSRYYVVSGSTSDTILVMNSTLTSVLKRIDLGTAASAAGLSPDGSRLLVLAGKLHVFDTTSANDDEITSSTGVAVGSNPTDVALAQDSSSALILAPNSGEAVLYDLKTNAVTGSVDVGGTATKVSIGPNGSYYVSATNVIYEIDAAKGTLRRTINVNGAPGRPAFTPDGKYALFPNTPPFLVTGVAFLLDLETSEVRVVPTTGSNPEVALDQVVSLDNMTFLGVSTSSRTLARVTVNPLAATRTGFLLSDRSSVQGLASSGELPQPLYLYVGNGASVSRGVTATSQVQDRSLPVTAGRIVLAGAASTNAPTGGFYRFNNRQTVTAGSTTQPLVLRVWDAGGAPVFGKNVQFTSQTEGVTFDPASTRTGVSGYAQTRVTVPNISGVVNVAAAVEGLSTPITFEITVAGGGGGAGSAGLQISSGNGQVVPRGFPSERPLRVRLTSESGSPISAGTVLWQIASGEGYVFPQQSETDADGFAESTFVGVSIVSASTSYVQSTITATVQGFAPVTFTATTVPFVLGTGAVAQPVYSLLTPASGESLTGRAGQTQAGVVKVTVKALTGTISGSGIPNVGVELYTGTDPATNPSATCVGEGGAALTDATGTATCDVRFGSVIGGPVPITILLGGGGGFGSAGSEFSTFLTVTTGPPTLFTKISGDGQTAGPGTTLQPLVAEISDGAGHVLPGTAVTWESLTPNTVTVVSSVSTADSLGRVSATVRLGSVSGAGQIRVRAGSAEAVFNVTVSVPIAALNKISGDNQSAILNQPFANPLVVEARNAQGQVIQGAAVAFTLVSGPATLGSAVGTTDASGRASTTVTAGATAGAVVVRATAGQFTATFNLTVSLPISSLTKISGDGQVAVINQDFAAPLVVEVRDGQGSPVSGAAVTFSVISGSATVLSGTATSGANGRASTAVRAGAAAGPVVIQAASFTFTATFNLFVVPPGPVISRTNIVSAISGDLGVTPGGIVAIYGQGIAPDLRGTAVANGGNLIGPLPTRLAEVEVLFGTTNAPIYHVNNIDGQEWVVVQAPFSLTPGQPVSITVKVDDGSTTIDGVEVKPYQPAIFETLGPAAQRWAVITKENGSYVSADNPIRKGVDRRVRIYCAGLGQTNPALLTNGVGVPGQTLLAQASLYILTTDGTAARVVSAEPMAGVVGIYVLTIDLPVNLETGNDKIMVLGISGASGAFTYNIASRIARVE